MKTKFRRVLWAFTGAHENLFDLSKEDLETFELLVHEARRTGCGL